MRDQFPRGGGIVLDHALVFWLDRVQGRTRAELYSVFAQRGVEMTPERWVVLVRLWETDGLTQRELAERVFKDEPTVSRILAGMQAKGWVVRRADAADGRTRRVHLTAAGRELQRELVPLAKKLVARIEKGISEADLAVTRRTLQRIVENLED